MTQLQEASWDEARLAAARIGNTLLAESIAIADCVDRTLGADCPALCDLPIHATSAMDGYAVAGVGPWRIVGEVKAGQPMGEKLIEGTAVRIATGAVIPDGTFGIVRWEVAEVIDEHLHASALEGQDIRPAAQECRKGELLIKTGTVLTPAWVGLLAAAGYDEVNVIKKPRVALLLLGDELQLTGIPSDGRVRDALGPQLPGWLMRLGAVVVSTQYIADELNCVIDGIRDVIETCDLIITTGGTADGPRDHIHSAISALEGSLVVDRVKVRPGHPMLLATIINAQGHKVPLLGLPGNPQSAIVALLTLGQPLILSALGRQSLDLITVSTLHEITAPAGFNRLVLGNVLGGQFEMGDHLGSAMLRGLANSSGFAIVGGGVTKAGTLVRWLPLP
ncbi:MAG: molybdopterin molybdotransferase MoeA [Actinomycetota bacterium]